ncbi:MAG: hypothetical protein EBT33_03185 [Betaproteobacteria bacterium]|nr:hypothetical protein [Betaproteobacteria bacterium]
MSDVRSPSHWLLIPVGQQAGGAWIDDTVSARIAESEARDSLLARSPRVGQFPRQRVEVITSANPAADVNELYAERGWTDGLPIVPPEIGAVKRMLLGSSRSATTVLGELEPLQGQATLEKVAANAVMAGCRPEHFSVVVAAVEALLDPAFNLRGVQTTDENVAPLLVVSGPIVKRLGINSGFGLLGPGWRANASIGRALRLIMQNIGGGWPGAVSYAGLGQAARYSLCIAEDESASPWPSLHADLGLAPGASAVTLLRAETLVNVTGGLEEIASAMASASSAFSIRWNGISTVIMSPVVARMLADQGLDKAAVRQILHERGRWTTEQWRGSWLYRTVGDETRWPQWVQDAASRGSIPVTATPDDLTLIVAGGDVPVPQHAWCPAWGYPACRITRIIEEQR